jgi:phytoene dehydrogenase-like protein
MPKNFPEKLCILALALSIISLVCTGPKTDEDQIRELMEEAGRHIEKKDLKSLMDLLAVDYTDFRGRDKIQTQDMVRTYFSEFRGIVVHVLGTRIDEITPPKATIQTDAALSSGAAKALRKLIQVSTDNYRFQVELTKKQDRWLIKYAEWMPIGIEELFPESLAILKKLFSDQ